MNSAKKNINTTQDVNDSLSRPVLEKKQVIQLINHINKLIESSPSKQKQAVLILENWLNKSKKVNT